MNKFKDTVLMTVCLLLAFSVVAEGKMYKWTDKDGRIHYGDKIPPEAIEYKHTVLDGHGITIETIERQKTKEEREAEKLAEQKAEEEKLRKQKEIAIQQKLDKILLDTFTTERDLLLTRKDRISSIDSMINLMLSNNRILDQQLADTQAQVERIEKNGQTVPENIIKKLENLRGQQTKNIEYMAEQNAERKRIVEQFDRDLIRYRELKGIVGEAAPEEAVAREIKEIPAVEKNDERKEPKGEKF